MKEEKKMPKVLKCISYPLSNKYLPEPYEIGERVLFISELPLSDEHPETFTRQFIKIKRLKSKRVETVARKNFE